MDRNEVLSLDEMNRISTWRFAMDVIGLKEGNDVTKTEMLVEAVGKKMGIRKMEIGLWAK
jgi:hypothetical protein